jgi:hypothetical protein
MAFSDPISFGIIGATVALVGAAVIVVVVIVRRRSQKRSE